MGIYQTFKLAMKSIISNKMRSFLTMLGIIIGVSSVIILMGLMSGVTTKTLNQFDGLSPKKIVVFINEGLVNKILTPEEFYKFYNENRDLYESISPQVRFTSPFVVGDKEPKIETMLGVSRDFFKIEPLKLKEGRIINNGDETFRTNTLVIGSDINNKYFNGNAKVGDKVSISGLEFTIIGILERSDTKTYNSFILVPYTTALRIARMSYVQQYNINITDVKNVKEAEKVLVKFLHSKLAKGTEKDKYDYPYSWQTADSVIKMVKTITGSLSAVLAGIAGISLLVAGIGIMNIMLVSVIERTKEIGIRKALGAKTSDILLQFVIESSLISSIGGIIGIIIGNYITITVGRLISVPSKPTMFSIILAFSVSFIIGVLFGYSPAKRAAKLNPIDALRNE